MEEKTLASSKIQAGRHSSRWHAWKQHLLMIVAVFCLESPIHAAPRAGATLDPAKSHEELSELRGRIEKLQREILRKEESRSEVAGGLKESERVILTVSRKLTDLSAEQREAQTELAAMDRQIEQMEKRIANEKSRIEKILQNRYRSGGRDRLKMLLTGEDPATVSRQLQYYSYISRARAELIAQVKEDAGKLAELQTEARQRADEIRQLKEQEVSVKKQLEAEQAKRKQILTQLSGQISGQRKEIGRLKQDEQRVTRLIEEINRALAKKRADEARRRAAAKAQAKAEKRAGRPPATVERNEEVPDDSLAGKVFASLKGRLKLPVRGELANRFGSPREAGATSWKGLFIRAETGQTVHAIADGRVVFADWLRGFGNLLIVDHGGGYMSLYGYNEALLKAVGQVIKSGDGVAEVGNTGGNPESGLYFELRYRSKPLDPLNWVSK